MRGASSRRPGNLRSGEDRGSRDFGLARAHPRWYRALDCGDKKGLGFRPGPDSHVLDSLGIRVPRCEDSSRARTDRAYAFVSRLSEVDSAECQEPGVGSRDLLRFAGADSLVLEAGEGALIPVQREGESATDETLCEGVLPIECDVEAVPGVWPTGASEGMVLVTALDEDVVLETGAPVAEVRGGLVDTEVCQCGCVDTMLRSRDEKTACEACGVGSPSPAGSCLACGSVKKVAARSLQGCRECSRSYGFETRSLRMGMLSILVAGSILSGELPQEAPAARNTIVNPCLHIVEGYGLEKMSEEAPTDFYYDKLREDMASRHPRADPPC